MRCVQALCSWKGIRDRKASQSAILSKVTSICGQKHKQHVGAATQAGAQCQRHSNEQPPGIQAPTTTRCSLTAAQTAVSCAHWHLGHLSCGLSLSLTSILDSGTPSEPLLSRVLLAVRPALQPTVCTHSCRSAVASCLRPYLHACMHADSQPLFQHTAAVECWLVLYAAATLHQSTIAPVSMQSTAGVAYAADWRLSRSERSGGSKA